MKIKQPKVINKFYCFNKVARKSDRFIVVRKFANKMSLSINTKHGGANGAKGPNVIMMSVSCGLFQLVAAHLKPLPVLPLVFYKQVTSLTLISLTVAPT